MASSGLMVFWFVFVVACIPVCLWLLKRSGYAQGGLPGQAALMKPISVLNLGPGQRLVAVELGTGEERTWLILSVTAQRISKLHVMPPLAGYEPAQAVPPAQAFASVLSRLTQAGKGGRS
ncbi:MAG: FliO/MopB family protein [Aquabacterium sp.]